MIRRTLTRWSNEMGSDPIETGLALLLLMGLAAVCCLNSLGGGPGQ